MKRLLIAFAALMMFKPDWLTFSSVLDHRDVLAALLIAVMLARWLEPEFE